MTDYGQQLCKVAWRPSMVHVLLLLLLLLLLSG
jgi:hypothetical protein